MCSDMKPKLTKLGQCENFRVLRIHVVEEFMCNFRRRTTLLLALPMALACPGEAATPITTSFQVRVEILEFCQVGAPPVLDFGSHTALTTAIDNTTSISVTCSLLTPYSVSLDAGLNSVSVAGRKMKGVVNANTIDYGLYSDAGHTINLGNVLG